MGILHPQKLSCMTCLTLCEVTYRHSNESDFTPVHLTRNQCIGKWASKKQFQNRLHGEHYEMSWSSPLATAFLTCYADLLNRSEIADFTGPVVSVPDGDTIDVLHSRQPERI